VPYCDVGKQSFWICDKQQARKNVDSSRYRQKPSRLFEIARVLEEASRFSSILVIGVQSRSIAALSNGLCFPSICSDQVCFACCSIALPSSQCGQNYVTFCVTQFVYHSVEPVFDAGHVALLHQIIGLYSYGVHRRFTSPARERASAIVRSETAISPCESASAMPPDPAPKTRRSAGG
jgi:hypothetical protein